MATYIRASHIRSLLKGISWRIIAITDTIVVVLAVTCFTGECSLENALKIGFSEVIIKLALYYIHERIWERKHRGQKITAKTSLLRQFRGVSLPLQLPLLSQGRF